jgi:hypothetical protein
LSDEKSKSQTSENLITKKIKQKLIDELEKNKKNQNITSSHQL